MLDIQLGRRNLSPIQRIAIAEKYRPIYEKQAKENLINAGKHFGVGKDEKPLVNLPNPIKPINTSEKLASVAGVSCCACRNHMDYIVTRNIRDYEKSKVQSILPGDFIKIIAEDKE